MSHLRLISLEVHIFKDIKKEIKDDTTEEKLNNLKKLLKNIHSQEESMKGGGKKKHSLEYKKDHIHFTNNDKITNNDKS